MIGVAPDLIARRTPGFGDGSLKIAEITLPEKRGVSIYQD
jgi:hypothetical protein